MPDRPGRGQVESALVAQDSYEVQVIVGSHCQLAGRGEGLGGRRFSSVHAQHATGPMSALQEIRVAQALSQLRQGIVSLSNAIELAAVLSAVCDRLQG